MSIKSELEKYFHEPNVMQVPGMEKENCFICGISLDKEQWAKQRDACYQAILAEFERMLPNDFPLLGMLIMQFPGMENYDKSYQFGFKEGYNQAIQDMKAKLHSEGL